MGDETPSEQLVRQRVRNRLIDYFELAASFDQQRAYQAAAPDVSVPNEVVNQFEDWVDLPVRRADYPAPVFDEFEVGALERFAGTWGRVSDQMPQAMPELVEALRLPEWEVLRRGAADALRVFQRRGRMPEDAELRFE